MKILMMLPAAKGVYPVEAEERRLAVMRSYTTAATQVDADYMPEVSGFSPWGTRGSAAGPDPESGARAHEYGAQRAVRAEQEGYDAFCPYGTLDVGVKLARERVKKIAVVGQSEACFLYCEMLGRKFASCSYVTGGEGRITAWAKEAGVEHLLMANTAIGIPNSQYPERRAEVLQQFKRCANEARAKGAELMGLVAMSPH